MKRSLYPLFFLLAVPALAATFTVTNTADSGPDSLRQVILNANSNGTADTINFSNGIRGTVDFHGMPNTIELSSVLPPITEPLVFKGPGADLLTVRRAVGAADFPILQFQAGFFSSLSVTVSGVTISGGSDFTGGGIVNGSGAILTVSRCVISNNTASSQGGGIANNGGTLIVDRSTLAGNTANEGAGIYNQSFLTVNQSTFSANVAIASGGGISNAGDLTLNNSTLSQNSATGGNGGGILNNNLLAIRNSLIAENTAGFGPDISGFATSNGANFIGQPSGAFGLTSTDRTYASTSTTWANVMLPLAANGGRTPTYALTHPTSPALNYGQNSDATAFVGDQRDYGPRINGGTVDIGAYESAGTPQETSGLIVTTTADVLSAFDGKISLRDAITYANSLAGPQVITFSSSTVNGAVNFYDGTAKIIEIASQLPDFTAQTTVLGPGAKKLTVRRPASAVAEYRILQVLSGATVSLTGFTVSGGNLGGPITNFAAGSGGGINNDGTLTLLAMQVQGNSSTQVGGIRSAGSMVIVNSTISSNSGSGWVGGIMALGPLIIYNSTISNNAGVTGGLRSDGGGTILMSHCTVAQNNGSVHGGLIGAITLKNSLVVGNTHGEFFREISGTVVSNGANFVGDPGSFVTGLTATDQTLASTGTTFAQVLGPLADNGGPTLTHLPVINGPAMDAGKVSDIPPDALDLNNNGNTAEPVPYDQRGSIRAFGPEVEIGAVEYSATPFEGLSLVVTGTGDARNLYDGQTTLRDAMAYANTLTGAQTITFSNTTTNGAVNFYDGAARVIDLSAQLPQLNAQTTITGPGATKLTLRRPSTATTDYRIMAVVTGGNVTVSGVTMTGGRDAEGGAIYNSEANLVINDCIFTGNTATNIGGAIRSYAYVNPSLVTLNRTIVSGNSAPNSGGGIHVSGSSAVAALILRGCTVANNTITANSGRGGGIFGNDPITLNNTTVSGNSAPQGGGICMFNGPLAINQCTISGNSVIYPGTNYPAGYRGAGLHSEFAAVTIKNSTITGNNCPNPGGGISIGSSGTPLTLENTLVAGNTGPGAPDITGNITTSNGANFIGNPAGATGGSFTDKTFASTGSTLATLLGPLANNGGPTLTHALVLSSPAINAGNYTAFLTDQRDYGPRSNGTAVDIGAYESGTFPLEIPSLVVTGTGDGVNTFDGQNSLREAIIYANTLTGPQTITFCNITAVGALNFYDGTARFIDIGSQLPALTAQTTLTGPGANRLTVRRPSTAATEYRVLQANAGSVVTLTAITISGGQLTGNNGGVPGGGILNSGTMTLSECTVTNNRAETGSGACNFGTMTIRNSTFTGNGSVTLASNGTGVDGAIFNGNTRILTVTNSTISGNAGYSGGGVGTFGTGLVTITNCTIVGNAAGQGGGGGIRTEQSISLNNSIVAGNSTASTGPDIQGPITSNGANFIGTTTGATGGSVSDKTFQNTGTTLPQLVSSLADNGGPTLTHALLAGSPAINAGNNANVFSFTTDQRGFTRLIGGTVDMGAYESGSTASTLLGNWRTLHSLAANGSQDLANPSGDGVPNLLKYAFNLAPSLGDLARPNLAILTPNATAGLPLITRNASGQLIITFLRRKASTSPGIDYTPETSSTLTTFSPLSLVGASVNSVDANWERVTVIENPTADLKRFGRVRIQATP